MIFRHEVVSDLEGCAHETASNDPKFSLYIQSRNKNKCFPFSTSILSLSQLKIVHSVLSGRPKLSAIANFLKEALADAWTQDHDPFLFNLVYEYQY